jgi:lipopolysaccharide export system protein LptA
VVYRGAVEVTQGDVKMVADVLTITLENDKQNDKKPTTETPISDPPAQAAPASTDTGKVKEMVATGNVRIDQGTRWAVGGRATYEQQQRTLVLTENPVLHDGPNEVVGERVTVYLDENRSVVEGGQKRVKAVFHPNEKNNAAPAKPKAATPAAAKRTQ